MNVQRSAGCFRLLLCTPLALHEIDGWQTCRFFCQLHGEPERCAPYGSRATIANLLKSNDHRKLLHLSALGAGDKKLAANSKDSSGLAVHSVSDNRDLVFESDTKAHGPALSRRTRTPAAGDRFGQDPGSPGITWVLLNYCGGPGISSAHTSFLKNI